MKQISKIGLLVFLMVMGLSFYAQTTNSAWAVSSYSVNFKIKNAKLNVNGRFENLTCNLNFDADKLSACNIEASVDVKTIKTGIDMRDNHLKKKEYFNTAEFPLMTIKTLSFSKVSAQQFMAKCLLTIKGKSKEITIPINYTNKGKDAEFASTFSLNRLDFGVGSSSIIMSNTLEVAINIQATKK